MKASHAAALALSSLLFAGAACGKKRGERAAPAGKPISPAVVEPLPAPRGQPKLPPPSPTTPSAKSERSPGTDTTGAKDAGSGDQEKLTE